VCFADVEGVLFELGGREQQHRFELGLDEAAPRVAPAVGLALEARDLGERVGHVTHALPRPPAHALQVDRTLGVRAEAEVRDELEQLL
jgi:hypothetical protein